MAEACVVVQIALSLLMALLDYGTQADILRGNLLGYKGAMFENLMADFLCKSGQKLYYFQKDSGHRSSFPMGELQFPRGETRVFPRGNSVIAEGQSNQLTSSSYASN